MHTPHEHGEALSEVIELTLAALERVAPGTRPQDLCAIVETILEGAAALVIGPERNGSRLTTPLLKALPGMLLLTRLGWHRGLSGGLRDGDQQRTQRALDRSS